jgi:small GTP-binding protein
MTQDREIKIVLMGMENAGKTTIINILQKAVNVPLSSPPQMDPTKGVERNIFSLFNKSVAIWDFGGQEAYRNEYIANPDKYFHAISLFYYVVDVQDPYRIFPSVMYFTGLFNLIKNHSPNAKLIFLFHKMDPNFDLLQKNLKKDFLERIEPTISTHEIKIHIYDTTIFKLESIRAPFLEQL